MDPAIAADTEMDSTESAAPTESAKVDGVDGDSTAVSSVQNVEEPEKNHDVEPNTDSSEGVTEGRTTESPTTGNNTSWSIIKCVYCSQVLTSNDDPKLLECLHSACGTCVKSKIAEENRSDVEHAASAKGIPVITCAACRIVCRQSQIIENQFLMEVTTDETSNESHKIEDQKCNSCADNETATSWCVECAEFICNECVEAHKRLKITKDHTIKSKEEGVQENQNTSLTGTKTLICPVHHNEQLTLFCENCDILTCRDCQLTDHRDHKYKFTHEIASETKSFISGMLKDVSYKRELLNSAMKVIDDRQNLISEKKQTLVKEITQMVVKLTNTINVRGKELIHRLSEVCDNKQNTLNEKKIALEHLSQLTDHCIEFVHSALEKGSDMAILFSKRHVTNHLQRIKCRRADIPNPEIPVRIHLALDKVPDLIKVLSSIGAIIVDGKVYPPSTNLPIPVSFNNTSNTPTTSPIQHLQSQQQPTAAPLVLLKMPPPYPQQQQQQREQQLQQLREQQREQHQQIREQQQQREHQQAQQQQQQQQQHQSQQQHQQAQHQSQQQPHQQQHRQSPQQQQAHPQHQPQQQQQQQQQQQHPPAMGVQHHMGIRPGPPHLQRGPTTLIRHHPSGQMVRIPGSSHQQVSSSTHPQSSMNLAGDRMNPQLRGLLQNNTQPVYVQTGPGVYQAVQPYVAAQAQFNQHQQQQRFIHQQQLSNYAQQAQNRMITPNQHRPVLPRPSLQPIPQQPGYQNQPPSLEQSQLPSQLQAAAAAAKWHIPQHLEAAQQGGSGANRPPPALITPDDSFKITLKPRVRETKTLPSTVTSTIPKTPSPSLGKVDETERNLDKFCEDSVNDLMATIAKLDSNGVQVLAEGRGKTGDSPHVDSSTDETSNIPTTVKEATTQKNDTDKDDPNEDWCAVCMDGGELVCCDKCPKVFHQNCHVPPLSVEESETWQCLLCMNFADIPDNGLGERRDLGLSPRERKIAERLVLELYCQYEPSLHFRDLIGPENDYYHNIIKHPISLEMIKQKVNWNSTNHYTNIEQLIKDVRLLFRNAYLYNAEDSTVYKDAKKLEAFFDQQLEKWLPAYAYENFIDEDEEVEPPNKKFRRILNEN